MIDIDEALKAIPRFQKICSIDEIYSLVSELEGDDRFSIQTIGNSEFGLPLQHVKFGHGPFKALIVGFPHCDEPIGGLTVFSLLSLLREGNSQLIDQGIEWHIVPCIDPDGAKLNEGWTQRESFSLEIFMKNFFKQNIREQVCGSFPVDHKKLKFENPTNGAIALMKIYEAIKPDFHFSLHNAMIGGSYFFMSHRCSDSCSKALQSLLSDNNIPIKLHSSHQDYTPAQSLGVISLGGMKRYYDHMENSGQNIDATLKWLNCGTSSSEYLQGVRPESISFVPELAHLRHPMMSSTTLTEDNLRQLLLRVDMDNKFIVAEILKEWDKVEDDLNRESPFYSKVSSNIEYAKNNIVESLESTPNRPLSYILSSPKLSGKAQEHRKFDIYMTNRFSFLCHYYTVVRLLKDSTQTSAIERTVQMLERLFLDALIEISEHIDFSKFEPIDVNTLAKVQISSGLIVLNSVLEENQEKEKNRCVDTVRSH